MLRQEDGRIHIEQTRFAITEPGVNEPFDARTRPGVERALHSAIQRRVVLAADRGGVLLHGKALFDAFDDTRVDAPAALPSATHVDVRLLGEEFGDGFDVEFGVHPTS